MLLKQLGIRRIVVAGGELTSHFPNQFEYLHLQVKDSLKEDISLHFTKVCDFIEEGVLNDEGVFVHCAYGISRSPTLVIAFLMKKLKIGFR
jgi:protein-tyrosine phosphatase